MQDESKLLKKIKDLKEKLGYLIQVKDICSCEVVELSRELDELINKYLRGKIKE